MIRYRYAATMPPAPMVYVEVRCPTTGSRAERQPALVDTGSDRTVLPGALVKGLGLPQVGELSFQGFGSSVMKLPVYLVAITLQGLSSVEVTAVCGEEEPFILLGRDVLNAFRIVLDGPGQALEIG